MVDSDLPAEAFVESFKFSVVLLSLMQSLNCSGLCFAYGMASPVYLAICDRSSPMPLPENVERQPCEEVLL